MVQREREGERIPESTAMEDRFVMALKVKKSPPPPPLFPAPLFPLGIIASRFQTRDRGGGSSDGVTILGARRREHHYGLI